MILLIDAGNTRVKWGVLDGEYWQEEGALEPARLPELAEVVRRHPAVRRAFGSNVAGARIADDIAAALAGAGLRPEWLQSSAHCCGVHNGYANPAQLGTDRWAALIGAHALQRSACLVINAGTATTIDVLEADGHFRGGVILPGERLMRRALAGNTAQLPFAEGRHAPTPRNTADAIVSGCLNAQAGAVERMFRLVAGQPQAICLISGGGAEELAALLDVPHRRVANLVLRGLAVIAGTPGAS